MIKNALIAFAGLLLLAQSAQAGLVIDVVEQNERVGWFDTYRFSHDLSDTDFVLGTAISGLLDVEIYDDRDRGRGIWRMELSGLRVANRWVDITPGESFNDVSLNRRAMASINRNGILNIAVRSFWGDFRVGDSTLRLTTLDSPTSGSVATVPEPGLVILLGAGLVGLGLARARV